MISTKVGRLLDPADPGTRQRLWRARQPTASTSRPATCGGSTSAPTASGAAWRPASSRLGLDRVDIALIHDPDDHGEQAFREAYPALEELRAEGAVRAIGVGMNQAEMLTRFVTDTDVDVVLVAGRYTLLDQSAARELLPAAQRRGVSVIAGGVFNSGVLAAPVAGATYDYQPAPPELIERARRLAATPARATACRCGRRRPASRLPIPRSPACSSAPAARPRSPTRSRCARLTSPPRYGIPLLPVTRGAGHEGQLAMRAARGEGARGEGGPW